MGLSSTNQPHMRLNSVVTVLGMHRSGTSAVTKAVSSLGFPLGERLMPAIAGVNPKGFFEDLDIVDLNEELLASLGANWFSNGRIMHASVQSYVDTALFSRARALISQRLHTHGGMYALKDPRLCRLMPFWNAVFTAECVPHRAVVVLRHPMEVAMSLKARDSLEFEKSLLLWLDHVFDILANTDSLPVHLVCLEEFSKDPRNVYFRLATFLDADVDDEVLGSFLNDFWDPSLVHHSATDSQGSESQLEAFCEPGSKL